MKAIDFFCVWDCCWLWLEFQKYVALLVFDPFVELFITLCIVVNTLFMALDHHDMDKDMERALKSGNYVSITLNSELKQLLWKCLWYFFLQFFTATFGIEALLKLVAMSPKFYFQEGWNIFDFIIVALSLLELGLEGVQGLSVLRSFRLVSISSYLQHLIHTIKPVLYHLSDICSHYNHKVPFLWYFSVSISWVFNTMVYILEIDR